MWWRECASSHRATARASFVSCEGAATFKRHTSFDRFAASRSITPVRCSPRPARGTTSAGRLPAPWRPRDFITFATALGKGIGRYITDLGSEGGQDAVYDATTNSLRALTAFSWYAGYEHWWTGTLRSTVTYGFVNVTNLDAQASDALHQTHRGSLNIAWSPLARVDLVTEFLTGRRVNKDGGEGQAGQVQFGWTFRF